MPPLFAPPPTTFETVQDRGRLASDLLLLQDRGRLASDLLLPTPLKRSRTVRSTPRPPEFAAKVGGEIVLRSRTALPDPLQDSRIHPPGHCQDSHIRSQDSQIHLKTEPLDSQSPDASLDYLQIHSQIARSNLCQDSHIREQPLPDSHSLDNPIQPKQASANPPAKDPNGH